MVLVLLAALALHRQNPNTPFVNECTTWVSGLYLPCSYVTPTDYPQEWVDRGQDV
ncbi:hypothetical protein [Mesorhizobium sp. M7A.F.Ca.MR.362.00.0.0]|uniref:hypothetical protein n=1 Tax=Mesorhizobium sp. M7A.F.Ca.MR.362.00.0.0 TaxID=2496779 RepID=UPI0013E328AD|nr:hypothetical protein [Mesorhizobium sp. M7A.F.Ca.MR.362.00.0.0]